LSRTHLALYVLFLVADQAQANPILHPLFRYAVYEGDKIESEYVGAPDGPFIRNFGQLPKADGPMEVDCRTVSEIGIVIGPVGVGGWIYGAKRKYHFHWSHSSEPPASVSRMQYRRNTPYGFLRNRIELDEWSVDGTIQLTISVEDNPVFETQYKLDNCEATLYRTPVPPSEMRDAHDTDIKAPEGFVEQAEDSK